MRMEFVSGVDECSLRYFMVPLLVDGGGGVGMDKTAYTFCGGL